MNKARLFLLSIACCVLVASCKQLDVFEKNTSVPQLQWSNSFKPVFEFDITDTAAEHNIYIVLRHTDAYRYNNIWVNIGSKFPGDTMRYQRVELQLGTDAQGWEGTGMDDIWEVRKLIAKARLKNGKYTFSLGQIMRENPLSGVMSVGMRVERAKLPNQ